MPNIGPMEVIVVLAIALLVLGPSKLPEIGKSLGSSIREFRKAATDMQEGFTTSVAQPQQPQTYATTTVAPAAAPVAQAPVAPVAPAPTAEAAPQPASVAPSDQPVPPTPELK